MHLPSRYWADLTARDFTALARASDIGHVVAVLPVGATEQHGPHLPLSVDSDLVDAVVAAALPQLAPDLPVLVLPTQKIGKSNEHARFPGTLTLGAETLVRVWTEIGDCVAAAGVRKLLLFNAHGGQVGLMDIVGRDLRARHDMIVYHSNWYDLPLADAAMAPFSPAERRFGVHAGDIETSMMLAIRPAQVDMAQARDFPSTSQQRAQDYPILGNGKSARLAWQMQDYNPQGAAGNAAAATADKGDALRASAGTQLALLLAELSRLPLSTLVDKPAFPH
ncbi:MAG: creatininase family protein [Rhodoferax sp.]|nr:creatininase family protein [Rhodoferax sp.]HQZ05429.1 creatininase family protein [Burkholderiaceae bacterium]